jgi:putative membrane protein
MAADPRVLFAAERTLMAWIRTGITTAGLGFVVAKFGLFLSMVHQNPQVLEDARVSLFIGLGLVLSGARMNLFGAARYKAVLESIAQEDVPPHYRPGATLIVAYAVVLLAAILAVYLIAS